MKRNLFTIMLAFLVVFGMNAQESFVSPNVTKDNKVLVDKSPNPATNTIQNGVKAQWDQLFTFSAVAAGSPGVETDGTNFYTTTWNAGDFHRYDMDGSNPVTFTVAGAANVRDMAYDGTYFYGAAANMNLFQMDLANETLVSTITATCSGITGIRHIAYDPTLDGGNGGFWIGNWNELGAIKMDGSEIFPNIPGIADCYGSAYDAWTDPANPKLWLFQQPNGTAVFFEFDINTQAMTGVTHEVDATTISGGACTYEAGGKLIIVANTQTDPNTVTAFELAETAALTAPAEPTAFTGTPDAAGALTIDLTWTNPALEVSGNALTELTSVDLFVSGTPAAIYTNGTPTIGGAETFTATVTAIGNYTFTVTGTNSSGTGIPATFTAYIGEDIPVAPGNIVLSNPTGMDATLTWEAPTAGVNGGYFNPANTTYEVFRNGTTSVYTGTDLTFTETLADAGNYFYTVVASNAIGMGGMGTSNSMVFGDVTVFDFESGIPSSFTLVNGDCGWLAGTEGGSGYFVVPAHTTYAYANDDICNGNMGDVWMITPVIDFTGVTAPMLQFESISKNDLFTIKVTTDGTTWTDVATITPDPAAWKTETVDLAAYANAPYVKIAFHYNDQGVWGYGWAVDDILINGVVSIPDYDVQYTIASNEYSIYPFSQFPSTGRTFKGNASNNGAQDVTNVVLNVDVNSGAWTGVSDGATIASGANADLETNTGFSTTTAGDYTINYSLTYNEGTTASMLTSTLAVSDSVYARDDNIAVSTLGIGDGIGGSLGMVFELLNDDVMTSVSFHLGTETITPMPANMEIEIFEFDDATGPGTLLYTSATFTSLATADWYMIDIEDQALPAGKYLVALHEHNVSLTLTTSPEGYTPMTNWVTFENQPWTPAESLQSNFAVNYLLRPNFGATSSVNDIAAKGISVYPNPSNGTFTVNVENNFNLEILDITGKLINKRVLNEKSTISIENAGIYFLKFSNEEGSVTQKVIVQ